MHSPVIAESARKHGVADDAIAHAFEHPVRSVAVDEDMTMLIGADPTGRLLEIGVIDSLDGPVIVHAMPARSKFLR